MSADHVCTCATDGYCPTWRREAPIQPWRGRVGAPAKGAPQSEPVCAHLGPATGALRECPTCQGNVRQKVFACAVHGDTTIRDCRRCRDYVALPEEPGGMRRCSSRR